jgi:hypothetical protein
MRIAGVADALLAITWAWREQYGAPAATVPVRSGDAHRVATPGQARGGQIPGGAAGQRAMNQQQQTTHALFASTLTTPASPPHHRTGPGSVWCP